MADQGSAVRMRKNASTFIAITLVAISGSAPPILLNEDDPPCRGGACEVDDDYIGVYYNKPRTTGLAYTYPPDVDPADPSSWFEYVAVINCPGNSPDHPHREICLEAVQLCDSIEPGSPGPLSRIMRREVFAGGSPEPTVWNQLGITCHTPSVPPRSGEPAEELTDAMILEQFHRTDFALPQMVIQPPNGQTLVNLPVYFELSWPQAGFEPGEVDTTTIVGHQVRIRPTLTGVTYITGDGASIGPTTSLGGPYPTGDITHGYTRSADLTPYISVEYGGEVSVDGGEWRPIPSSATVDGPAVPLQVLQSRNRLYDG